MYTTQQVASAIANNTAMPAGNMSGPDAGAGSDLFPYPLVDASGRQQQEWIGAGGDQAYPYGRDAAWMANWGRPDAVRPTGPSASTWSQWSSPDWVSTSSAPEMPGSNGGGVRRIPGADGGGVRHMAPSPAGSHMLGPGGTQSPESAYLSAARAFDLTSGGGGCAVDDAMYNLEKQSLYAGHRLFGNLRIAQGNSGLGEVLLNGKAMLVNPAYLDANVQRLNGQEYYTADAYRDDSNLAPFAKKGGSAGGVQPELYVGTISEGLSAPLKQETMSLRSFLPTDMPSTFNIFPESESAAMRKENVCRLNRIQRNYINSRVQAASTLQW